MPKVLLQHARATSESAIAAALDQNWKEATRINSLLITINPKDIDAHNRLGFAYLKTGQLTQAKKIFERALKIDPYNQISLKNSKKLESLKKKDLDSLPNQHISPLHFLEEPGKTKIVSLVNPAQDRVLIALCAGQEVYMKPKNHCVEIRTGKNTYLGTLPDDISFKLLKLLSGGNTYQTIVKGIAKNSLTILIREMTRGKKFTDQPSFSSGVQYISITRDESKDRDIPDITPTGEDEAEETRDQEPIN